MKLLDWIKNNKLSTALIIVLLIVILPGFTRSFNLGRSYKMNSSIGMPSYEESYDMVQSAPMSKSMAMPVAGGGVEEEIAYAPVDAKPEVNSRMVTRSSSLSLLVKNVTDSTKEILAHTESMGGFMVNSSLSNPQESASGYLVINVPSAKFDETMDYLTKLAVKVVSQNLTGRDITEQYSDLNSRLEILTKNKARFEEIMNSATKTDEILRVQREIFSLQNQIDSLLGQKKYLEEKAKYSQIAINLSTDELSLPYTPDNKWRPVVVFKNALRSMLTTLQKFGNLIIWLFVFVPVFALIFLLIKLAQKALSFFSKR